MLGKHLHQRLELGQILGAGHSAGENQKVAGSAFGSGGILGGHPEFAAEQLFEIFPAQVAYDLHPVGTLYQRVIVYRNSLDIHAAAAQDIQGGDGLDLFETVCQKNKISFHNLVYRLPKVKKNTTFAKPHFTYTMDKLGFDKDKYLAIQSNKIKERIAMFGDKLYLEFGGKLFDDFHASRVLPGFAPDSKITMLLQMKDEAEIVLVINAADIEKNKIRGDLGITYDMDVLRLIDAFRGYGLYVSSVVLTRFENQANAIAYQKKLEGLGLKVYRHYPIAGYPSNMQLIMSDEGYGKNDFIETSRRLVVVTAPGPGSGKMATCLSQLWHEKKRGVKAGYAKFETFPVWSLPLKHPVNLAYEAATVDLKDVNMIDPYHLEAYGKIAVNYNRDVEIFPVLNEMLTGIIGQSPYKSPTDMGVNMIGSCISDDDVVCDASRREIIRRYYNVACQVRTNNADPSQLTKLEMIMEQAKVELSNRKVAVLARQVAEQTGMPAAAIEMNDGTLISGKTSDLLGCSAAMLLNALKYLADIPKQVNLISPIVIEPICNLKINHLGHRNPRLHINEVLLALSICALTDINARNALEKIDQLRCCEVHTSVILSSVDVSAFRRLGVNLTSEPTYQSKNLYHAS